MGGVDRGPDAVEETAAGNHEMEGTGETETVEVMQRSASGAADPARFADIENQVREVTDQGVWCQHTSVGADARTIEGAAVDSAPKLAIAQPRRLGLGSCE